MPTRVTFECKCPLSAARITLARLDKPSERKGMLFKASGSKSLELTKATYALTCAIVGEPETDFSLKVTKGGTMNPIERTLGSNGRAASNRDLTVE